MRRAVVVAFLATGAVMLTGPAQGGTTDWVRFRGQNGDGKSAETGLMKEWPEGGPKLLWKLEGLGRDHREGL